MECPRCEAPVPAGALECPRCGVIFSRITAERPRTRRASFTPYELERVEDGRIGPGELKVLAIGALLAIVAYAVPFIRFVCSVLVTLFHELGHAVAGWLMGYPSLPAFDLVYGGGLTHHGAFRPSLAIAISLAFAFAAWTFRHNRKSLTFIGILFGIWLLFVTREWRRELVFAAAGHLAECILTGVFFYRALSGAGWRSPEVERPLGAFIAFFVQIHTTHFAWRLIRDASFQSWYREGKGGALMNDLEVIALNLQIWMATSYGIADAARWLLAASLIPLPLAFIWYRRRSRWHSVLRALGTAES